MSWFSSFAANFGTLWLPVATIAAAAVAHVVNALANGAEDRKSSRVARIEGTVARVAGGIAADLLNAKTANTGAEALATLKSVALAQGASYVASVMPATLQRTGVTPNALVAMINGEIGRQIVAGAGPALLAAAPGLLAQAASALLATDTPAATSTPGAGASAG